MSYKIARCWCRFIASPSRPPSFRPPVLNSTAFLEVLLSLLALFQACDVFANKVVNPEMQRDCELVHLETLAVAEAFALKSL